MNFSYVSSSSQKSSGFEGIPSSLHRTSQSYETNYHLNLSTKKLKVEHSQNGIVKSNTSDDAPFESVKLSGSIPYAISKPKSSEKISLKGPSYKIQNMTSENNINGKRAHPDLAALELSKTIEDFKRAKSYSMIPTRQAPPAVNSELYEMMRLLNTPVPDMSSYGLNYGKFPFQMPQNNRAFHYPPASAALQGFEQQLNYYNQMAHLLQQQQMKNFLLGDLNSAAKNFMIPSIQQPNETPNLTNSTTFLIEDLASQKKNLKLNQEHLEKRHKISSVTEVRLEDSSSENKVFTFASSKFNVTINKKSEQDNLEDKRKASPPKEDKAVAGISRKQTISNNFQGINLSTSLVTPVHQRIPILY